MKKLLTLILVFALTLAFAGCALAVQVNMDVYSDAPANPTQENVLELEALAKAPDQEETPYALLTLPPTKLGSSELADIFSFVDVNKQPPARYFPEEVQQEIEDLLHLDPDVLYMPEFMSVLPAALDEDAGPGAEVEVSMLLEIDYEPGRPVVVVLGFETEEGLQWKAIKAKVVSESRIVFTIPADMLPMIAGSETLFSLMSIRPGTSWQTQQVHTEEVTVVEENRQPHFVFSKSFEDMTRVERSYSLAKADGEGGGEGGADCQIVIVPSTTPLEEETLKISEHLSKEESALMAYFDEEINRQAALMLPEETDLASLVAYELTHVRAVGYDEPYGDVAAVFTFATPYTKEQAMLSLLALPQEDGTIAYTPLRTECTEDGVEITFSSTVLPAMMEETALLLVPSTPIELPAETENNTDSAAN